MSTLAGLIRNYNRFTKPPNTNHNENDKPVCKIDKDGYIHCSREKETLTARCIAQAVVTPKGTSRF